MYIWLHRAEFIDDELHELGLVLVNTGNVLYFRHVEDHQDNSTVIFQDKTSMVVRESLDEIENLLNSNRPVNNFKTD